MSLTNKHTEKVSRLRLLMRFVIMLYTLARF